MTHSSVLRAILILLVAGLLIAPTAAEADLVQVEIVAGLFVPLERNTPGLQIVEDRPGHFILANHPPIPAPAPTPNPGVPQPTYSGQRPASGAKFGTLISRAEKFWASGEDRSLRSVGALDTLALCPDGVSVYTVPSPALPGWWGVGWHHARPDGTMACAAWLRSDLVAALLSSSYYFRREACTAMTHEIGHAYGLQHTPTGVMAGEGTRPPRSGAWAPFFCRRWARDSLRSTGS